MVMVPPPVASAILKDCIYRAGICASPVVFHQPQPLTESTMPLDVPRTALRALGGSASGAGDGVILHGSSPASGSMYAEATSGSDAMDVVEPSIPLDNGDP